jgi:serine/threonine protein kinase/lipoprotein NlpI
VGGGYRLVSRIGSGGFGEVWRAEAPGGVEVAIKVIFRPSDHDEIQRELESLAVIKRLRHQFLLQTQAFWSLPDRLLIVMELADGNLRDRNRECKQAGLRGIAVDELIGYFREAGEALDFLHLNSVQHRDIKPDNILLLGRHAKVGDFGLVRMMAGQRSVSVSGSGTPAYMAPEVWRGKASSYSDQYSLAAAYGEMRLQRALFTGQGWTEVMLAHLNRIPDLSGMGAREQQVVLKALAKDAGQRYPNCLTLVRELEKAVAEDQEWPAEMRAGVTPPEQRDTPAGPVAAADGADSISFAPPPIPPEVERSLAESKTLALEQAAPATGFSTLRHTPLPSHVLAAASPTKVPTTEPPAPRDVEDASSRPKPRKRRPLSPQWLAALLIGCLTVAVCTIRIGWYAIKLSSSKQETTEVRPFGLDAEELAALPPDAREAVAFKRAGDLFENGEYQGAAEVLREAIQQFPEEGLFHQVLGHCQYKLRSHLRAVESYSTAVQLNPRLANAYANRGRIYVGLGRYEEAVEDATRALGISPTRPSYLVVRGTALRLLGKLKEAQADLTEALRRDEANALAYVNRGLVHADLQEYDLALADFNKALELSPGYGLAYLYRGNVYRDRADYEKAFSDYDTAHKTAQLRAQVHAERGEAFRRQGQLVRASEELEEALRQHSLLASAYTTRGLLRAQNGQLDEAIQDHSTAIRLEPRNAQAYFNRHLAYLAKGLKAKADQDLDTARRLKPRVGGR